MQDSSTVDFDVCAEEVQEPVLTDPMQHPFTQVCDHKKS